MKKENHSTQKIRLDFLSVCLLSILFFRAAMQSTRSSSTLQLSFTHSTRNISFFKKKRDFDQKDKRVQDWSFFLWGKVEEREREEEAECRKFSIELLYHCDDYCYYYCYYLLNMLNFRRQNKTVHVKKKITEKHASKKEEKKKHICIST